MGQFFGTDGIRGKVGELITPAFAYALGRAMRVLSGDYVVIAWDTRESSKPLADELARGLKEVGKHIILAGVIPTPGLAYYTAQNMFLGVMITASHNPYTDNGFKIFDSGIKLLKPVEQLIEDQLMHNQSDSTTHQGQEIALVPSPNESYLSFLGAISPTSINYRFGCDFANGATYLVGNELFKKLYPDRYFGSQQSPNGQNINAQCGALFPKVLSQQLANNNAAIGFSFDGDGDRIIMSDASGRIYDGDDILYLLALDLKDRGELANDTVVLTVMSNLGVIKALERQQIKVVITDVGDANVLQACLDQHLSIGAEASGHIMLPTILKGGDGLLIATQLLSYINRKGQTVDALLSDITRYAEVLINVKTSHKEVVKAPQLLQLIEEIKAEIKGDGKVFVRASGTEPLIRITVSAASQASVELYSQKLQKMVELLVSNA